MLYSRCDIKLLSYILEKNPKKCLKTNQNNQLRFLNHFFAFFIIKNLFIDFKISKDNAFVSFFKEVLHKIFLLSLLLIKKLNIIINMW